MNWCRKIFYALYPRKCFVCHTPVLDISHLCDHCSSNVERYQEVIPCVANIDGCIVGYHYANTMKIIITRLKFQQKLYMVRVLEELLAPVLLEHADQLSKVDCIVPMPVDRVRLAGRGFNQMQEIASIVHKYLKVPIQSNVLKKRAFSIPQVGLSRKARLRNLTDVFYCQKVTGHVLLLDDVLTTGRTLECASMFLKRAGASAVTVLIIAKA